MFDGKKMFLLITVLLAFLQIKAQTVINKPLLQFTDACANSSLSFGLSFRLGTASNFQTSNVFTVELSDPTGSFTTPIVLATSNLTVSPINVVFQFPNTLPVGLNYKIRIKSSAPAVISVSSDPFPARFMPQNQSYTINNNLFNQSFCQGGSYVLSIDSGGNSPLQYPQLSYIWYKDNNVLAGEIGNSLTVSQSGSYYVKTNYGNCPSNSYSNFVNMISVPAQTMSITSQNNQTVLCGAAGIQLSTTSVSGTYVYEWYRDNVLQPNSNNPTFTATQTGSYFLKIANNACITPSNIITITSQNFNLTLDSGIALKIIPGQNVTLNATTSAVSPTYKWYKNTVLQAATTAFYTTNQAGSYKLVVKEGIGCQTEKEVFTVLSYPSNYNYIINHITPFTDCVSTSTTLGITQFSAIPNLNVLSSGAPINYRWFKDGSYLNGVFTNTLNISNDYLGSGVYIMEATFNDGSIATSSAISVRLKFNPNVLITSNQSFICNANPTVILTPNVTNNLYAYNWFKKGTATSLSTSQTYIASAEGDYFLKVSYLGCEITTNTVTIKKADITSLVINKDSEIEISEGQNITITASGADSYVWSLAGQPDVSTPTFNITQAGTITLIGTFGLCSVKKIITVTNSSKVSKTFIPNAVTPNNDGTNDTWTIPEEFAYKDDIEVVIFSSRNEILFQSKNYLNNWPITPVQENSVYYYKIMKDSSVLEKGTISILK